MPLQPVGVPFVDPVFGTTLRRVSDTSDRGGFETHIYSQLQAFSADSEYLLLDGSDGFLVRRVDDLARVQRLVTRTWNAPRWHPTRHHVVVHFDSNDDATVRLQYTDVDTLATTTVFTFRTEYQYVRVNQSFDELSHDGRWLAGMLTREDGASVIFSLDLESLTLGAVLALRDLYASECEPDPQWGALEPDWIGVSPLGTYLVVQWVRDDVIRCSGLETLDIRTGEFAGRVQTSTNHGDLGLRADGLTEIFMTTEFYPPDGTDGVGVVILELPGTSTASPPVWLQSLGWSNEDHISMQGPSGVALVSWGRFPGGTGSDEPFDDELFLQYADGSIRRLVHHRSSLCGYWVQPRASLSRDGRYAVFASDWGQESRTDGCADSDLGRGDPYLIDLVAATGPE